MEFVTSELAKKFKEKGFREECLCHYIGNDLVYNIESPIVNNQLWFSHNKFDNIWHRDNIDAPTISQALKWLRKNHNLDISTKPHPCEDGLKWLYEIRKFNSELVCVVVHQTKFQEPEQAALAAIDHVLDNLMVYGI